jgi:penicillin-binding protein 1A
MDKDQSQREAEFREMLRQRRSGRRVQQAAGSSAEKQEPAEKPWGKPRVSKPGASEASPTVQRASLALRTTGILVVLGLVLILVGLLSLVSSFERVRGDIERVADAINEVPGGIEATQIFANDYNPVTKRGTLLASRSEENRTIVPYEEIPPELIACLLSTEDHRFFEHHGVDYLGTMRAIMRGVARGGDIKGTSTITQQLSRNVFLPYIRSQRTLNRKIQEVIFAMALEKRFTKQEILEGYLNHVFLGSNSYGVRAAALKYFDKDLDKLSLAECALLAGIPQAPTKYNPYEHPEEAKARRNIVLSLLRERLGTEFMTDLIAADPDKFAKMTVTAEDIDKALNEPIKLSRHVDQGYRRAGYFADYVASEHVLYGRYNENQVKRQGLIVVTTLDPQIQQWAEEIVQKRVDEQRKAKHVSQAAVIVLEAKTGAVLACVGGYKFGAPNAKGQPDMLNRAMVSDRPVGSSFKPFTYATAYEQGFSPKMLLWDGPNKEITAKTGKLWPTNSDNTYRGWISMFYALQMSRNAAAVDLITNCTGIQPVIGTARKMGITTNLPEVPALTLGVADIKPVEMAEAFATFSNMGIHVKHVVIREIYLGSSGILLESNENARSVEMRSNRALTENTAWMMVQNMMRVVNAGTGTRARVAGVQIAGKTGTNDDFADAWFVGYSPELVCAVWVGNDDYRNQMNHMYGGDLPAIIFHDIMTQIYTKQSTKQGEGDTATEMVTYQPRFKQTEFVKPTGATFNGFPGAVTGGGLVKDADGNWITKKEADAKKAEEAKENGGETPPEDGNGFYEPYEPPPHENAFW